MTTPDPLRDAAEAVLAKLEAAVPAIDSLCVLASVHGTPYSGPTFGVELTALRAALPAHDARMARLLAAEALVEATKVRDAIGAKVRRSATPVAADFDAWLEAAGRYEAARRRWAELTEGADA